MDLLSRVVHVAGGCKSSRPTTLRLKRCGATACSWAMLAFLCAAGQHFP